MENNLGAILLMLDAIRLEVRATASDVADTRIWRDKADERAARAEATWNPTRWQCMECGGEARHRGRCSHHVA